MRSLSLHYGTIKIASVAGESRRIGVSGLAKARLLWLFRNFSILEFPVLSKAQQQLIYEMWNSGMSIPLREAPRDVIGTIEAFSPQLCPEQESAPEINCARPSATRQFSQQQTSSEESSEQLRSGKLCSESAGQPRARFTLRAGLHGVASWRAFTILLLGAAMYLGHRYLPPKHPGTPQPQVAAIADERQRTGAISPGSEAKPSAPAPAQPASADTPAAALPVVAAAPAPLLAPVASTGHSPVSPPVRSRIDSNAVAPVLAPELPDAMAHKTSVQQAAHPAAISAAGHSSQEVLIRVSVDAAGQAQSFEVLRGEQEKQAKALKSARLWKFKPCAGGEACQQVLKFTDYGDSSRVQRIE